MFRTWMIRNCSFANPYLDIKKKSTPGFCKNRNALFVFLLQTDECLNAYHDLCVHHDHDAHHLYEMIRHDVLFHAY